MLLAFKTSLSTHNQSFQCILRKFWANKGGKIWSITLSVPHTIIFLMIYPVFTYTANQSSPPIGFSWFKEQSFSCTKVAPVEFWPNISWRCPWSHRLSWAALQDEGIQVPILKVRASAPTDCNRRLSNCRWLKQYLAPVLMVILFPKLLLRSKLRQDS